MKVTIDTENKTIIIEQATTDELKQLCKDYKGFTIQSGWSYSSPTYPMWQFSTGGTYMIDRHTTTSKDVPYTLTN